MHTSYPPYFLISYLDIVQAARFWCGATSARWRVLNESFLIKLSMAMAHSLTLRISFIKTLNAGLIFGPKNVCYNRELHCIGRHWLNELVPIWDKCNCYLQQFDPWKSRQSFQIDLNCKKIIDSVDLFNQTLSFVVNILLNVCLLFIGVSILRNSLWHY